MQQSKTVLLQEALSSVTKALLARNSRFAQEVLSSQIDFDSSAMIDKSIWNHIRSIAELALRINEEPQLKAYEDLPLLAEKVTAALASPENAKSLLNSASEIYERISRDVQIMMKKTPNNVNRGVNLILLANHYVQIARCATFLS